MENCENLLEKQENGENSIVIEETNHSTPEDNEEKDVTVDLLKKITDFEVTTKNLQDELTKKADVINEYEKTKVNLEKEVNHVS
jgi:hypothetical protein